MTRSLSVYRWAQEFLNEQNKGLDVLVEYLSHAQSDVSWVAAARDSSLRKMMLYNDTTYHHGCLLCVCVRELFRFEVESVENGGTLSDKGKPAERSMEDLTSTKSYSSSHSHGMTRAARALTVRWGYVCVVHCVSWTLIEGELFSSRRQNKSKAGQKWRDGGMRGGSSYFHYTLQVKRQNVKTPLVHQIQLRERLTATPADDLSAVTPSLERNVLCVEAQPLHSPDTDKKHWVSWAKRETVPLLLKPILRFSFSVHLHKAFCQGSHKPCLMPSQRVDFNPELSSLSRQFDFIQENVLFDWACFFL